MGGVRDCDFCKNPISSTAERCPHCGRRQLQGLRPFQDPGAWLRAFLELFLLEILLFLVIVPVGIGLTLLSPTLGTAFVLAACVVFATWVVRRAGRRR